MDFIPPYFSQTHFVDRYFIPKESALILLVAYGFNFISRKLPQQKTLHVPILGTLTLSIILFLISTKRAAFGLNEDTNYHHSLIVEESYPTSKQPIILEGDPKYFPNAYLGKYECLLAMENKSLIGIYNRFSTKIKFSDRMKILITGICGFAGSSIAKALLHSHTDLSILGLDNFSRRGSEINISQFTKFEVDLIRGDIRSQSDIDALPKVDWVIDCAANPSVLAGLDGKSSSRQLMEHNLMGTINLLEYCKKHKAGLILLSTSRVYSAKSLANLPVKSSDDRFELQNCDANGATG